MRKCLCSSFEVTGYRKTLDSTDLIEYDPVVSLKRRGNYLDEVLYLDTARLGKIANGAQRALTDVLRFNKAYGASTYFDDLLFGGHQQLKSPNDFRGLRSWNGIENLRTDFKHLVFGKETGEAVFASRSSSLMALASKMVFSRCRNVLVTDLNWQPYVDILTAAIPNDSCKITFVPIKHLIFDDRSSASDLVHFLKAAYIQNGCDGLFLPAVCDRGVKLPVKLLLEELKQYARVRFSLMDAAQAINHIDLQDAANAVDFTIAGTHKWLRAFEPMGVGLFATTGSCSFIRSTIERYLLSDCLADPLLQFTESRVRGSETVNLQPLFAASGAISDSLTNRIDETQLDIFRSRIVAISEAAGWTLGNTHPELATRIVLAHKKKFGHFAPDVIRKFMMNFGVAISDFGSGQCRVSTPDQFSSSDETKLQQAMVGC